MLGEIGIQDRKCDSELVLLGSFTSMVGKNSQCSTGISKARQVVFVARQCAITQSLEYTRVLDQKRRRGLFRVSSARLLAMFKSEVGDEGKRFDTIPTIQKASTQDEGDSGRRNLPQQL